MGRDYDAVVVGGGHNGLVAAAYLARAGRSVLLLERLDHVGGAAVSEAPFAGVDARVSRYAYLVSLLPAAIVSELGLGFAVRERRVSSYTPVPGTSDGVLIARGAEPEAWRSWQERLGHMAGAVFPSLLEPLPARDDLRRWVGDDELWEALVERPLGETLEAVFPDDVLRGIALTDGLIGTFAHPAEPSLRQNRCFLYHVIGSEWNVPVGGMGALIAALVRCAGGAGAELVTGAEVTAIETDGQRAEVRFETATGLAAATCDHVVAGCAPAVLARLLGEDGDGRPEGAQLKVNMLLSRLPRLRDASVAPADAFAGTFHVNETYNGLAAAFDQASAGDVPTPLPCEVYCHTLTDPSILGGGLEAHTLTLFSLQTPARLFDGDRDSRTREALAAALRSLDSVLAEPIEDCLLTAPDGRRCLEAKTPLDLEDELALPRGCIFHRDLAWPFAESEDQVGTWGTETAYANVQLGGAGARRGGGVSGIPGRNAAMAVLAR
jgi:phytoene dehydrogenase-like protein